MVYSRVGLGWGMVLKKGKSFSNKRDTYTYSKQIAILSEENYYDIAMEWKSKDVKKLYKLAKIF